MMSSIRSELTLLVLLTIPAYAACRVFTTPGLPACFISNSNAQGTELFQRCDISPVICTFDLSNSRYVYCSTDHECCSDELGCPSCCIARDDLSRSEIAGLVVGISTFVFIVLALSVFLSVKFCSKGQKQ